MICKMLKFEEISCMKDSLVDKSSLTRIDSQREFNQNTYDILRFYYGNFITYCASLCISNFILFIFLWYCFFLLYFEIIVICKDLQYVERRS